MAISEARAAHLASVPVIFSYRIGAADAGDGGYDLQFRRGGFITIGLGESVHDLLGPPFADCLAVMNRHVAEKPATPEDFGAIWREVAAARGGYEEDVIIEDQG